MHTLLKFCSVFFFVTVLSLVGCGGGGGGGTPAPPNAAPLANAGADVKIPIDKTVATPTAVITLDGSLSSDPEGGTLTYTWTAPSGVVLTGTEATPTFTATRPGVYPVSLVVSDGPNSSTPDFMTVTVYDTIPATSASTLGLDAIAIEGATDGDLYVLGTIPETVDPTKTDIFVQKIDPSGIPVGQLRINIPNSLDFASDLIEISPGIVAIVGTVEESGNPLSGDVYLAVVDLTGVGNLIVDTIIPQPGDDLAASLRRTSGDGLLVSGSSFNNGTWVMRFIRLSVDLVTPALPLTWDIPIDAPGTADFGIDAIEEDPSTIVVLGDTTTSNLDDIYLARVNVANPLVPIASKSIAGAGTDVSLALENIDTGGFLVVGSSNSFGSGGYDILAVKTDSNLQVAGQLADYAIGGGRDDFSVYARKVTASTTGFLITGATQPVENTTDPTNPDFDAVLLSLDAAGGKTDQGVYTFDVALDEVGLFARELPLGSFQLAGIRGTLDFINPADFSVSSGDFFTVNIDKSTMLLQ